MERKVPVADSRLLSCLNLMVRESASDIFLLAGAPPTIKRQGDFMPIAQELLTPVQIREMAYSIMSEAQIKEFESRMECDLAFSMREVGRFRVNVHMQRGHIGMVARFVTPTVPSIEELGLPQVLKKLAFLKGGLVLTVGAAGSGKTTTLASMLNYRNELSTGHILTIEDPIEYLHGHKKSLITQREVGLDTLSYDEALRHAMREAPNVIMIGEIRDRLTMQHALHYAESGHLCVSTLHANNANQAVQRIMNFFPDTAQNQLLMDLSLNLKAVVAQRLVHGKSKRLVPAVEVMLLTPYTSEMIQKGRIDELKTAIERSTEVGMCSFDQSLFALYERGEISEEEMVANADNKTDITLKVRLAAGASLENQSIRMAPEGRMSGV